MVIIHSLFNHGDLVKNTEPTKHGPWRTFYKEDAMKLKMLPGLMEYFKRLK